MPRFAQYGGAAGADAALKELIMERIAAEMEQRKRSVEDYKLSQADRGLDLEGGRLGLEKDKFGQQQTEYTEAAPQRAAQTGYLRTQTQDLENRPIREADARAQAGMMAENARLAQEAQAKTQHDYRLGEIAATGNQQARVAGIRSTNEPLMQVQLPDGRIVYMPRSQAAGAQPPAPAALRTQADAMKSVGTALRELKKVSDTVNVQSGVGARVTGMTRRGMGAIGLDPTAKVFEDTRSANAIRLSRALGEVGVLTNQDIQRAVSLIPDLGATKEEAALKFTQVEQLINSALQAKGLPPIDIQGTTPTQEDGGGLKILSIEEVP